MSRAILQFGVLCFALCISMPSAHATDIVLTGGTISATNIDSSFTLTGPNFIAQGGSELTGKGLSSINFAPGALLTESTLVNLSFGGDFIVADGVFGEHDCCSLNPTNAAGLSLIVSGSAILPNIDVPSFTWTWAVALNGSFGVTNGVTDILGNITGSGLATSEFQRWTDCSRFTACYQAASPLVITIQSVPEPSAVLLLTIGIVVMVLWVRVHPFSTRYS